MTAFTVLYSTIRTSFLSPGFLFFGGNGLYLPDTSRLKSLLAKIFLILLPVALTGIHRLHGQERLPLSNLKKASSPSATVSLYGRITEASSGQPVAGASVNLPDVKKGAITNSDGEYLIRNLAAGNYWIEISSVGYQSISERITLTADLQLDFSLQPSILENEPITITGVSVATRIRRTPAPVVVLNRKELTSAVSTNLMDALSREPGISQISTGPSISKPVIRGLGYNRVVVLNDGIRQEGQQWGDEHGIEIDEYSVQRVEILKGPASLIYGSDALAGVINVLTNLPAPENTIKGSIIGNYQSNNRLRGLGANLSGNQGHINWNLYGSLKTAGDYSNKYDGRVFNSRFREKNFGGYIGYNGSRGFSHFLFSNFHQSLGLVSGTRDSLSGKFTRSLIKNGVEINQIAGEEELKERTPAIPYQDIHHVKIALENRLNAGGGKLDLNMGYQLNNRKEFGEVITPNEPDLHFNLTTFTYRAQYHFAEWSGWQITLGVNGMQQSNSNKAEEVLIPAYSLFDFGNYIYVRKNYDRFTISGGIRMDYRRLDAKELSEDDETRFQAFNRSFSNLSGSAGISYELTPATTLKLNIARGFRAPSMAELAANGAHEGTNRYEYGDQNLRSESSLQLDQGIDIQTSHLSLSASGFVNFIDNFIFYRKLESISGGDSVIVSDHGDLMAFQYTQAKTLLYGAECNLDIHPHPLDWLHFENTFSFVRGVFTKPIENVKNLPLIPAARWITQLRGEFLKKGKAVRNLTLSLDLDNTFSQKHAFTAYATETPTNGYALLNFGTSAGVVKNNKELFTFYFTVNNLADVAYQNHLSRLKYTVINYATGRTGVYNMGRNFSFKINIPLSFDLKVGKM